VIASTWGNGLPFSTDPSLFLRNELGLSEILEKGK